MFAANIFAANIFAAKNGAPFFAVNISKDEF
jgi:hypothetical protein